MHITSFVIFLNFQYSKQIQRNWKVPNYCRFVISSFSYKGIEIICAMSAKKGVDFLKQIAEFIVKSKGYDSVMKNVKITGGGEGKCIAEFTVCEEHLNRGGGLHGGFTATLVDNVTTYALMSKDCHPGVSVDLHVSYLKAAKAGDEVVVNANTVKAGKTLAYIECELIHKKDGSIIAKGAQTKYVAL